MREEIRTYLWPTGFIGLPFQNYTGQASPAFFSRLYDEIELLRHINSLRGISRQCRAIPRTPTPHRACLDTFFYSASAGKQESEKIMSNGSIFTCFWPSLRRCDGFCPASEKLKYVKKIMILMSAGASTRVAVKRIQTGSYSPARAPASPMWLVTNLLRRQRIVSFEDSSIAKVRVLVTS
jgi:hypothetical protein